jgi:hypothetical protein
MFYHLANNERSGQLPRNVIYLRTKSNNFHTKKYSSINELAKSVQSPITKRQKTNLKTKYHNSFDLAFTEITIYSIKRELR